MVMKTCGNGSLYILSSKVFKYLWIKMVSPNNIKSISQRANGKKRLIHSMLIYSSLYKNVWLQKKLIKLVIPGNVYF